MRAKSVALLLLALGCGLVASIGITQVMANRKIEPASAGETKVFIAVKDIPLGEHLTAELLKLEPWPKDKIPQGTISKMEDVEGRRTRTKLYAGEPILENKLFGKGMGQQGDSSLIPKGFRVVPVKVDNVSGGPGLIVPGDRVDVLVHLTRNPSQDIQDTSTRTILQDIKVFAVNDVVDLEREKDSKDKEKITAKTISLLVTPSQAAKLTLASEMGKVRLIMRPLDDDSNSNDGTANPSELFGYSQKAIRVNETLDQSLPPKSQEKKSGLSDFMNTLIPGTLNETWTMRILQPNSIDEVVLEADNTPQAAKMPQGAWRLSGTSTTGIGGGSNNNNSKNNSKNNKRQAPRLSAPAAKSTPPAPQLGLPPTAPVVQEKANPSANSTPHDNPPNKDPFADPDPGPSDEPNQATGEPN